MAILKAQTGLGGLASLTSTRLSIHLRAGFTRTQRGAKWQKAFREEEWETR